MLSSWGINPGTGLSLHLVHRSSGSFIEDPYPLHQVHST